MTAQNDLITRIRGQKRRIARMQSAWVRGIVGQSAGPSASGNLAPGRRFLEAAQKMRILKEHRLGAVSHPESAVRLGKMVRTNYGAMDSLMHFKPHPKLENSFWSEVEQIHPAGGSEAPAETGPAPENSLRQGSVIQKFNMFPSPGQSLESFKSQTQSIPKTRQPARREPEKKQPPPGTRLFSRVQEMNGRTAQPAETEPEADSGSTLGESKPPVQSQTPASSNEVRDPGKAQGPGDAMRPVEIQDTHETQAPGETPGQGEAQGPAVTRLPEIPPVYDPDRAGQPEESAAQTAPKPAEEPGKREHGARPDVVTGEPVERAQARPLSEADQRPVDLELKKAQPLRKAEPGNRRDSHSRYSPPAANVPQGPTVQRQIEPDADYPKPAALQPQPGPDNTGSRPGAVDPTKRKDAHPAGGEEKSSPAADSDRQSGLELARPAGTSPRSTEVEAARPAIRADLPPASDPVERRLAAPKTGEPDEAGQKMPPLQLRAADQPAQQPGTPDTDRSPTTMPVNRWPEAAPGQTEDPPLPATPQPADRLETLVLARRSAALIQRKAPVLKKADLLTTRQEQPLVPARKYRTSSTPSKPGFQMQEPGPAPAPDMPRQLAPHQEPQPQPMPLHPLAGGQMVGIQDHSGSRSGLLPAPAAGFEKPSSLELARVRTTKQTYQSASPSDVQHIPVAAQIPNPAPATAISNPVSLPPAASAQTANVVQRVEDTGEQSASGESAGGKSAGVDLDKIAQDVLPIIKRLMEIEAERNGSRR